ncbi:MAG: TldD/PmbA family protein [Candidatus Micrarchaeia archaeon]
MLASEILKKVLENKFDEAVVSTYDSNSIYVKIANHKVDSVVEENGSGGGIYVTKDKRIAFTNIMSLDEKGVQIGIENLKTALAHSMPKEDYFGIAEGGYEYKSKSTYDTRIADIGPDQAASLANDFISKVNASDIAGTLYLSKAELGLATSNGVDVSTKSTAGRLSLRIFAKNLSFQDSVASRKLSGISLKSITDSAKILEYANKTSKIKPGSYDIIYSRAPAGSLLSTVNSMACIGEVESGGFLTGKLGNFVADKGLSLYDDGISADGVQSSPFDDEGYPTQKTKFIDNGKLVSYLHNYSTARKYNVKSTGNAGLVEPESNTLVVDHKKKQNLDKLIEGIDKGLLVSNVWYTRFSNYLTGDFSTMPKDITLYIENGNPVFAVRQINISSGVGIRINDNMLRMLKNITKVGNDLAQSTSWDSEDEYYFTPSIIVNKVKVSTA